MAVIRKFTDLDAWKEGHRLVVAVYGMVKVFPRDEVFGLVSQMKRCSVSITSNIAEGFSRHSAKDKKRFYVIALGSVTELQNQLLVARDVGYITHEQFLLLAQDTVKVHKITNGLIKNAQSYRNT